jgi:hypothetical protein
MNQRRDADSAKPAWLQNGQTLACITAARCLQMAMQGGYAGYRNDIAPRQIARY